MTRSREYTEWESREMWMQRGRLVLRISVAGHLVNEAQ
jgi:hypothetical protein